MAVRERQYDGPGHAEPCTSTPSASGVGRRPGQFPAIEDVLRLQRTAGNRAVQRALVQRWLTLGGNPIDRDAAFAKLAGRIAQAAQGARTLYSPLLLKNILQAGESIDRAIPETVIEAVYLAAGREINTFLREREEHRKTIAKLFASDENQFRLRLIHWCTAQSWFHDALFVVVIRGMSVEQGIRVMTHGTFGGAPPRAVPREPPTEQMAVMQTGLEQKKTAAGTFEEWSVTAQKGFATEGVIMVAVTRPEHARFPPIDKVRVAEVGPREQHWTSKPGDPIPFGGFFGKPRPGLERAKPVGEVGVTGWTDQPFARVRDLPLETMPFVVPAEALATPLCAIQEIGRSMEAASPADAVNSWIKHKGGESGIAAMLLAASPTAAASPPLAGAPAEGTAAPTKL